MSSSGAADEEVASSFFVQCTGQVISGDFGGKDYLYCRYSFQKGHDWTTSAGVDSGLSQTACKNPACPYEPIVWNFPIDISFSSTNVFGWPRIAVSVYGIDFLGRDVIRGYGSVLVPLSTGKHEIRIEMFAPLALSNMHSLLGWLMGNPPEFFDSKFVCQGEGREVTRVQHTGSVVINLNIQTKGMQNFGYSMP